MAAEDVQNGRIKDLEHTVSDLRAKSGPTWSMLVAVALGVLTFGTGVATYVQLFVNPQFIAQAKRVESLEVEGQRLRDFKDHVHYEMGVLHTLRSFLEDADRELKADSREQWLLLRETEKQATVNEQRYQWGFDKPK
jgi:hypothetical protein